jgi:hypothetical protein
MFQDVSFDSDATQAMGRAYDIACNAMRKKGADETVQETIARRIVIAANKGERDPTRLYEQALAAFGIDENSAKQMAA